MTEISNVDENKRQILEQKKTVLMEKLKDIQFKLWDKSTPEVIEHISQLELEKVKLQSLLSQAHTQLEQLEPEIQNCNNDAEKILLEAISKQDWYGFKNKREIVFDSRTGILFPNFEFIKKITYQNWHIEKENFSPNGIAKGEWNLFSDMFYKKIQGNKIINPCIGDQYDFGTQMRSFCYPQKFKGKEINYLIFAKTIDTDGSIYRVYLLKDFITNPQISDYTDYNSAKTWFILPAYHILNKKEISPSNIQITAFEKAKIILDFFIEQDFIPDFDQELSVDYNHDYNQIFEAYYQRIKIQKQLVELDEEISELPELSEPVQSNVFSSDFDYLLEL